MKANDDNLVNIINNNGNHKKSFKTGEKIEFPNPNFKIKNTSVEPRNKNNDQYENNVINLGNNLKVNKLKYDKIENNYEENMTNQIKKEKFCNNFIYFFYFECKYLLWTTKFL